MHLKSITTNGCLVREYERDFVAFLISSILIEFVTKIVCTCHKNIFNCCAVAWIDKGKKNDFRRVEERLQSLSMFKHFLLNFAWELLSFESFIEFASFLVDADITSAENTSGSDYLLNLCTAKWNSWIHQTLRTIPHSG